MSTARDTIRDLMQTASIWVRDHTDPNPEHVRELADAVAKLLADALAAAGGGCYPSMPKTGRLKFYTEEQWTNGK